MPQAYLKAFATDITNRSRVWRLSKEKGDPELKRIDKVAVRFHLYVPRDKFGRRDDTLERKLGQLERWFKHPIWSALCNDMVDLEWQPIRKMVALLTAVMFLRNPLAFEQTKRVHRQLVDFYTNSHGLPSEVEIDGNVYRIDARD